MNSEEALKILKDTKQLSDPSQQLKFLETVRRLEQLDSTIMAEVFTLFSDEVQNDTPLKYLANLIGMSEWKVLLPHFILSVPYLKENADSWLNLFLNSVLDEHDFITELSNAINHAPIVTREILRSRINDIAEEDLDLSLPPELLDIEEHVRNNARQLRLRVS